MRFQKRKNYKRKRSKLGKAELPLSRPPGVAPSPALCSARRPAGPAGGRGPALVLTRGGKRLRLEGVALGGEARNISGC